MATTRARRRPAQAPSRAAELVYETAAAELLERLERETSRVFVVDIQDPAVFDGGHIPGARNIHIEDLVESCADLPKDLTIVIYCGDSSCGLPYWAALELAQAGYCAKFLHGGLAEWRRREYPVESSPPPPDPEY
jgi:rhodanese-related sulfurtransferase